MKKIFAPVNKSVKDASEDVRKTLKVTSKEIKEAIVGINNKFLQVMKDWGILFAVSFI